MSKYFGLCVKVHLVVLSLSMARPLFGQGNLKAEFRQIADSIKGSLGVSALDMETGESISFNGNKRFPMQSVYKVPIAMVMLHQVDAGKFSLTDTIPIAKAEYIPQEGHSPLRDKSPNGTSLTIERILKYAIVESDGTASDVMLRLLGGARQVQEQIHALGVRNMAISTTEMVQVANDTIQYQNWATPEAMNELLKILYQSNYLSESSKVLLLQFMSAPNRRSDRRIKGLLPKETVVAHKTGTSGTYNGLTRATNDAGIITLPDGSHLAISVFISDSYDSQKSREMAIAKASKAAYDYWIRKNKNGTQNFGH